MIQYLLIGVAVLVAFGGTYVKGRQDGREGVIKENAKVAVKIVKQQAAATTRVVTRYVKVAAATQSTANATQQELDRYAKADLDRCPLSVAARGLHDSAAAGTLPDAARSVDGAASGLATAALTQTCAANYAEYHKTADRLRGLQEWIREQGKAQP